MSCGTCGIQASDTMQSDTGVPAGAPTTATRPRCPRCKAFLAAPGAACNNPRCPPIGRYVRQDFLAAQQRRETAQHRAEMLDLLRRLYRGARATAGHEGRADRMPHWQRAGQITSPADPALREVLVGLLEETTHFQDPEPLAARQRAEEMLADVDLPPALRLQRELLRWGGRTLGPICDLLLPPARMKYWDFADGPALQRAWSRAERQGHLTPALATLMAHRAAHIQAALAALAEHTDAAYAAEVGAAQVAAWVRQARIVSSSLGLPAALAGALATAGLDGLPIGVVADKDGLAGLRVGAEGPDSIVLRPVADPSEPPAAATRWQVATPPLRKPSPPEDAVAAIKRTVLTLARQTIRAAWMMGHREDRATLRRLVDNALEATAQADEVEVGENVAAATLVLDDTIYIYQYPRESTVGTSWQAVIDEGEGAEEHRPLDKETDALFGLAAVDPRRPATVAETAVLWLLERKIHEALLGD